MNLRGIVALRRYYIHNVPNIGDGTTNAKNKLKGAFAQKAPFSRRRPNLNNYIITTGILGHAMEQS